MDMHQIYTMSYEMQNCPEDELLECCEREIGISKKSNVAIENESEQWQNKFEPWGGDIF